MFITSVQYLGTGKMIPLVKSGPSTPVLDIAGTGGPMNFRAPVHTLQVRDSTSLRHP